MLKIPLSVTIHAHELYANPNKKFFEYCILDADKIVSISEKNRSILIDEYGVNKENIRTIRLSIDLDNFQKIDKVKVLTVSRFEERKGFYELFEAIRTLNRDDVEFIVVGFGDLDVRSMIKEFKIENKVIVFDKMDPSQLKFFYNNCDIFCLPSKSTVDGGAEGIPVVLMEAMASEMIVVTTANGSIPELVDDIIVLEEDSKDLSIGIDKAIKLMRSKKNIGVYNRDKVLSEYSDANIDELNKYLYK